MLLQDILANVAASVDRHSATRGMLELVLQLGNNFCLCLVICFFGLIEVGCIIAGIVHDRRVENGGHLYT